MMADWGFLTNHVRGSVALAISGRTSWPEWPARRSLA
jgi:hypothetical protein